MAKKLHDFAPIYEAEQRLVDWLQAGHREEFFVSRSLPPVAAPQAVRLRAEFIRYLALGGCEDCAPSEKGLGIFGAYIEGDGPEGAETPGLDLEGCTLKGDLTLFSCRLPDLLLLRGAQVQNLFLDGAALMNGMTADRLEARGNVVLGGVVARGEVRLLGAKLGGGLDCEGAKLTAGEGDKALNCDGAEVSGAFFLRKGAEINGVLDLTGARFGHIVDDEACWPTEIVLDRCRYGAFTSGPVDAAARLRWLALQRPEEYGQAFWPQPYEECARALREAGHGGAARDILIEKERLQREDKRDALRAANRLELWAWLCVWDGILGWTVRYGRAPLWAFAWLAGFWRLGPWSLASRRILVRSSPTCRRCSARRNGCSAGSMRGKWRYCRASVARKAPGCACRFKRNMTVLARNWRHCLTRNSMHSSIRRMCFCRWSALRCKAIGCPMIKAHLGLLRGGICGFRLSRAGR